MSVVNSRAVRLLVFSALVVCCGSIEAADRRRPARVSPPAAASLVGRITDAATGAPVLEAVVAVQGKEAMVNQSGSYNIQNLTTGSAVVEVRRWGYLTRSRTITLQAGANSLDIALQPGPIITVTTNAGATLSLDYELSEFIYYSSPLSSPQPLSPLNICRADGTSVDVVKSDLRTILGPPTVVSAHPCCPQGNSTRLSITLKTGTPFEAFLPDCRYYLIAFQGRDRQTGQWRSLPLTQISRVDYPQ